MTDRRYVDSETLAEYLGTTPRHIKNLVYRRAIPHTHVGRLLRFDLREIDRWVAANAEDVAS